MSIKEETLILEEDSIPTKETKGFMVTKIVKKTKVTITLVHKVHIQAIPPTFLNKVGAHNMALINLELFVNCVTNLAMVLKPAGLALNLFSLLKQMY